MSDVFCKKTEFRPDNFGILHTMRVHRWNVIAWTFLVDVEHSCRSDVDLIDLVQRRGSRRHRGACLDVARVQSISA